MTLNALALELIRAHKENAGDADYVLTVEQWIRDALQELGIETEWRAFVTNTTLATVVSQQFYTLPTRVKDIRVLRDPPTETYIEYVSKERLANLGLDLEQQGRPSFWYYNDLENVSNDFRYEIGFQPIPNAIFTLDVTYQLNPSELLTSDHIPIQVNMLLPLKFCTRAYMSLDDKDTDSADRFYQRYLKLIDQLVRAENHKYAEMPRMQMRDIPGRGADRRLARLDPNHFS